MNTIEKRYADTDEGVLEMLKENSIYNLDNAETEPDPWVSGVWKVTVMDPNYPGVEYVIAYLADNNRQYNDFESIYSAI